MGLNITDQSVTEEGPRPMCDEPYSSFFRFADNCYLPVNDNLMGWNDAETYCSQTLGLENVHLTSLNDMLSLHYASATGAGKLASQPFWIGMRFHQVRNIPVLAMLIILLFLTLDDIAITQPIYFIDDFFNKKKTIEKNEIRTFDNRLFKNRVISDLLNEKCILITLSSLCYYIL